ncbi:MAG: ABC transporter ATP-binding protein [Planctomycetales bacterium]|nr:ABC transporter ATP-binding protein [Planctomycetales bacterium]
MLDFRDVQFDYGGSGFSLRVRRFELPRGARWALTGPSGSGKTTLLHLAGGVLAATRGEVTVAGRSLRGLGDRRRAAIRLRHVGMVFQSFELLPHLRAIDNILLPFRLCSSLPLTVEAREFARQLASALGIEPLLRRYPHQLSHGERQRVSIARALVTQPQVVLADEPTGSLDPSTKREVLTLLLRECERMGATLLMATHDHGLLGQFDGAVSIDEFREAAADGARQSAEGAVT